MYENVYLHTRKYKITEQLYILLYKDSKCTLSVLQDIHEKETVADGTVTVKESLDGSGNRSLYFYISIKIVSTLSLASFLRYFRLVGDVSPTNMRTPENFSDWLRFGSADH